MLRTICGNILGLITQGVTRHSYRPFMMMPCRVRYKPSEKTKIQLYAELLPMLNSGRVVLPRHERLIAQLVSLESLLEASFARG